MALHQNRCCYENQKKIAKEKSHNDNKQIEYFTAHQQKIIEQGQAHVCFFVCLKSVHLLPVRDFVLDFVRINQLLIEMK